MYSQLHRKFSHKSGVERILKIGPHLPKLLSNIKGYTFFGTRCSCAFTVNRLQCCLTSTIQYQQCSSDLLHSGIIYFTVLCCCCFSLLHISMAFATVNLQCTKDAVTAPFMCMLAACNRISASKYFYYVVQVNYSCCQSRNWKLLHLYCCPVAKILRLVVHCYLTTRMHSRHFVTSYTLKCEKTKYVIKYCNIYKKFTSIHACTSCSVLSLSVKVCLHATGPQ